MNQADFIRKEKFSSNQHFERISDHLITPLESFFKKTFNDTQIKAWVEDMAPYSNEELDACAKELRRKKTMPSINEAISACQRAKYQRHGSSHSEGEGLSDVYKSNQEREREIQGLCSAYVEKFKQSSSIYTQAVSQNWSMKLLEFVRAVAEVQAQMIVGTKNGIGWSSGAIFGYGTQITKEEIYLFFQNQRQLCSAGRIEVSVPTGMIRKWESQSQVAA